MRFLSKIRPNNERRKRILEDEPVDPHWPDKLADGSDPETPAEQPREQRPATFYVFKIGQKYHWTLRSQGGDKLATTSLGYTTRYSAKRAIGRLQKAVVDAKVKDI